MESLNTPKALSRIVVTSGKRKIIVRPSEIIFIKAESNYSHIMMENFTRYLTCQRLLYYEKHLSTLGFFRCHKSYLVNLGFIIEIDNHKEASVTMLNGEKIPVARRKLVQLKNAVKLSSWLSDNVVNYTVPVV